MSKRVGLTGNDAAAEAMRQVNPDVVAAYPITPQTELMHKFADFVANGKVDTEMILVESEHSAMSASVGAAAAGARTMTATCANGLALMWEVVYIAASLRLPMVMSVVNRALSGPINIHCDHSDSMGCRDAGWIQLFSENSQEAYDNVLMAVKIAETSNVQLPVMVTLDGFIISHTLETLDILEDDEAKKFVGKYTPAKPLLDFENPVTVGPLDLPDYYFEHKRQQAEGMANSPAVIKSVSDDYAKLSGRSYGFIEEYKTEDAEVIMLAMGSTAGTARIVVDELREKGEKVGVVKIRTFRPFPHAEVAKALSKAKGVAVMDRCISFGGYGNPVFMEVRNAMFGNVDGVKVSNYVYGLGGRDIGAESLKNVFADMKNVADGKKDWVPVEYVDVR